MSLLGELDRLADDRVDAAAVEERELVEPEPERGQRRRVEVLHRPRELLDHVVEAELALDGAEGELHRERSLARVEASRLGVKRPVRVGPLLEDAPHDCERGLARRRDPRACDYHRIGTSYARSMGSPDTSVAPSIWACAMSIRSNGSP